MYRIVLSDIAQEDKFIIYYLILEAYLKRQM